MIQFRANLLNAAGSQKEQTAKVATVTTDQLPSTSTSLQGNLESARPSSSYAERLINSPPMKQSTTRCGVCESYHATVECAALAKLHPDEKVKKLREHQLCFHCLQRGHEAKSCPADKPRCVVCHRPHNSILHGRSFPSAVPHFSAQAASFQPASSSDGDTMSASSDTLAPGAASNPVASMTW